MFALNTLLLTALYITSSARSVYSYTWGFPYDSQKVRGVNLGGWLLLEYFITPSLFEATGNDCIVDEYTFTSLQDRNTAAAALRRHWDTFIVEDDFREMRDAGLNHVRLPVGYWAYEVADGEPWIQGQLDYVNKAVEWANKYGLKLIIDLHGAPGSQNGFDNSGQATDSPSWHSNWNNVDRTNRIIRRIADTYKDNNGVVPIIAPLNEPFGWIGESFMNTLKQFYYDSYGSIRWPYGSGRTSNTIMLIHDAFMNAGYWSGFMDWPGWEGVMMDTHIYQIFDDYQNGVSEDEHIRNICRRRGDLTANGKWTIVGEWAPVNTDCTPGINGRGNGSRYEGTLPGSTRRGSCAGKSGYGWDFSQEYKNWLRKFWEAQVTTYESERGWLMWTWKTEKAHEWSYQAGLYYGWIPWNPTERAYPNVCG